MKDIQGWWILNAKYIHIIIVVVSVPGVSIEHNCSCKLSPAKSILRLLLCKM